MRQSTEHFACFFRSERLESNRVEKAKEGRSVIAQAAIEACVASDNENARFGLKQTPQLLLPILSKCFEDLTNVLHEDHNGAVDADTAAELRLEGNLVRALHLSGGELVENRGKKTHV